MGESPQVWIILPVHNRREITLRFVASLARQTKVSYRLILVDDGSTDGTADAVTALLPETVVIRGTGKWWWAGAIQQALDWLARSDPAGDPVVLIINDDTEIPENFLATGYRLVEESPRTLFCARAFSRMTAGLVDMGVHVDWKHYRFEPVHEESRINCLSTRGLFLRLADVSRIGGFRPQYLPHYLSDYEFTIRASRREYSLRSPPELTLKLDEDTTGVHALDRAGLREYLRRAYQIRSAINPWTALKFVTLAAPVRYLITSYLRIGVHAAKSLVKAARNGI